MPLSARLDGEPIYAFDLDDDAASALTARVKRREATLTMACGRGAFLRVSKLGTRHFVHGRAEVQCDWGHISMTAEHMAAQRIIIEAARAAGWDAVDEVAGGNDEDGRWRADVMASRGGTRVAFEVQWSRQSDYRYEERQAAYARDRVRAAWFSRGHGESDRHLFTARGDLPIFRLSETQPFIVRISDQPAVPLAEAVTGLLGRRWRFERTAPAMVRTRIIASRLKCHHCGAWMTVHGVESVTARPLCADAGAEEKHVHGLDWPLPGQRENDTRDLPELASAVRAAKLPALAPIRPRTTRANADYTTHVYGCPNCPRINASPEVSDRLHRYRHEPRAEAVLERHAEVALPHWCSGDHAAAGRLSG